MFVNKKELVQSAFKSQAISQEGILDSIKSLFKKNTETVTAVERETFESLSDWWSNNVKSGKLDPSIPLKDGEITIRGETAGLYYRNGRPITSVISEINKDYMTLLSLWKSSKPAYLKANKLASEFESDVWKKTKQFDTAESLLDYFIKNFPSLPVPIPAVFRQPSSLLGDPAEPIPMDGSNFDTNNVGSDYKSVSAVSIDALSHSDANALIKLGEDITALYYDLLEAEDGAFIGLDATDPPYRAYSAELWESSEFVKYFSLLSEDLFHAHYDICSPLSARVLMLIKMVYKLLKESTTAE